MPVTAGTAVCADALSVPNDPTGRELEDLGLIGALRELFLGDGIRLPFDPLRVSAHTVPTPPASRRLLLLPLASAGLRWASASKPRMPEAVPGRDDADPAAVPVTTP